MSSGMTAVVTLQREAEHLDPESDEAQDWREAGTFRAEVKPLRFTEDERQGAMRSVKGYLFRVYTSAVNALSITEADRLVWNGLTLNIREVRLPEARVRFTDIIAEAGVSQ